MAADDAHHAGKRARQLDAVAWPRKVLSLDRDGRVSKRGQVLGGARLHRLFAARLFRRRRAARRPADRRAAESGGRRRRHHREHRPRRRHHRKLWTWRGVVVAAAVLVAKHVAERALSLGRRRGAARRRRRRLKGGATGRGHGVLASCAELFGQEEMGRGDFLVRMEAFDVGQGRTGAVRSAASSTC